MTVETYGPGSTVKAGPGPARILSVHVSSSLAVSYLIGWWNSQGLWCEAVVPSAEISEHEGGKLTIGFH